MYTNPSKIYIYINIYHSCISFFVPHSPSIKKYKLRDAASSVTLSSASCSHSYKTLSPAMDSTQCLCFPELFILFVNTGQYLYKSLCEDISFREAEIQKYEHAHRL